MSLENFKLTYACKKTGQLVTREWAKLPDASKMYLAQKGFGEYGDNYHASVTVKEHGASRCKELVIPMVNEAFVRLDAGDVPGNKSNIIAEMAAQIAALEKKLAEQTAAAMAATPVTDKKKSAA